MQPRDSGRVHEKLIRRLERQEKQKAFQRDRFLKFKLPEIHNKLTQTLLMKKIVETDTPSAISDALLKGLTQAVKSSEFDFKYFIAPIRTLVPRPNPYSLFMTQYIMEVLINEPHVIEIYGTDEEIYRLVNEIFSQVNIKFERAEEEAIAQISREKGLLPGSRDYEIRLDQLFRQKVGDPQKM